MLGRAPSTCMETMMKIAMMPIVYGLSLRSRAICPIALVSKSRWSQSPGRFTEIPVSILGGNGIELDEGHRRCRLASALNRRPALQAEAAHPGGRCDKWFNTRDGSLQPGFLEGE